MNGANGDGPVFIVITSIEKQQTLKLRIMKMSFTNEAGKIEAMKELWCKKCVSPSNFFYQFYAKYSHQTYLEFLEMINVHEKYSPSLKKAVDDLEKS